LVKRLRRRPLTAESGVRFPHRLSGSLLSEAIPVKGFLHTSENTVTLRNNILVNEDLKAIEDTATVEYPAYARKVTVTPSGKYLVRGSKLQFSAFVEGDNLNSNSNVVWSLNREKVTDDATVINPDTGELTMGPNETGQTIQVIATSSIKDKDGKDVYGEALVSASFMNSATMAFGENEISSSGVLSTANKQLTVTITVSGGSMEISKLNEAISASTLLVKDDSGAEVADVEKSLVSAQNTDENNTSSTLTDGITYKFILDFSNDQQDVNRTISLEIPYEGCESINLTRSLKLPLTPAVEPISGWEIREVKYIDSTDTAAKSSGKGVLWRGEKGVYTLYIKRGDSGEFHKVSEDTYCTSSAWSIEYPNDSDTYKALYSSSHDFLTKCSESNDSIEVGISRSTLKLAYKIKEVFRLKISITDLANKNNVTSCSKDVTIPAVKMTVGMGKEDGILYDNIAVRYNRTLTSYYTTGLKLSVSISGLSFETNEEIEEYINLGNNEDYIIDFSKTPYQVEFWPDYPSNQKLEIDGFTEYLYLGDVDSNSNGTFIGLMQPITYNGRSSNVEDTHYYISNDNTNKIGYTGDGKKYTIVYGSYLFTRWNGKQYYAYVYMLTINGNQYYSQGNSWYLY
jgi:hypothetical protein